MSRANGASAKNAEPRRWTFRSLPASRPERMLTASASMCPTPCRARWLCSSPTASAGTTRPGRSRQVRRVPPIRSWRVNSQNCMPRRRHIPRVNPNRDSPSDDTEGPSDRPGTDDRSVTDGRHRHIRRPRDVHEHLGRRRDVNPELHVLPLSMPGSAGRATSAGPGRRAPAVLLSLATSLWSGGCRTRPRHRTALRPPNWPPATSPRRASRAPRIPRRPLLGHRSRCAAARQSQPERATAPPSNDHRPTSSAPERRPAGPAVP